MIVRQHLSPAIGKVRLADLTPDQVQSYLNKESESGLSARTVQYHHAVLRRGLVMAERRGLVARNVAKLVSPPAVRREEVRPPNVDQAREFIGILGGERQRALYLVALCLGLRQSEILGLTWEDVDLDQGTLTVRHSLQRYAAAYHLDAPKTLKSRRTLPLPGFLVGELRSHRVSQNGERLLLGQEWRDQWGLVFTNDWGDPMGGTAVTRHFQGLLDKAELPRWRFHDLRHAAATFMLARGVSLHTVKEVLGHSTIAMTANVYGHVAPEVQRDATEQVAAALMERV
jgi:integrase